MYRATAIVVLLLQAFSSHVLGAGVTVQDMKNDIQQLRDNTAKNIAANVIPIQQIEARIALYESTIVNPGTSKIDQAAAPYFKTLNETKAKAALQKKDISACLKGHEDELTQLPTLLKSQLKANISATVNSSEAAVHGYERQLNSTMDVVNGLDKELATCKGDSDQQCILLVGEHMKVDSVSISNTVRESLSNASSVEISSLSSMVAISKAYQNQMTSQGQAHLKMITDCTDKIIGNSINTFFYEIYSYLLE